jgi:hypothetical protein
MRVNRLNANFTGAGFVSRNKAAVSWAIGWESRCALLIWPPRKARNRSRQRPGATFEVTEMQPSPP